MQDASGELINNQYLAVFDDVILVQLEERMSLERILQMARMLHVSKEIAQPQHALDFINTFLGDGNRARLGINRIVFVLLQPWNDARVGFIEFGGLLSLAGDNQRGSCLVN